MSISLLKENLKAWQKGDSKCHMDLSCQDMEHGEDTQDTLDNEVRSSLSSLEEQPKSLEIMYPWPIP